MLAANKAASTAVQALCKEGNSQLQASKFQEALACFEKALAQEPKSVEALRGKGVALWKLGKLPEAASAFDLVLKLDQNSIPALMGKGGVLKDMSDILAKKSTELEEESRKFSKQSEALASKSTEYFERAKSLRGMPKPQK